MEFKRLTLDNLDSEHICCAITDKKGESGVSSKKDWLRKRLSEGLVFDKLDEFRVLDIFISPLDLSCHFTL